MIKILNSKRKQNKNKDNFPILLWTELSRVIMIFMMEKDEEQWVVLIEREDKDEDEDKMFQDVVSC